MSKYAFVQAAIDGVRRKEFETAAAPHGNPDCLSVGLNYEGI
jgi:hypothetical protein